MKTSTSLIAAAIAAPTAVILGAPLALVVGVGITSGLAAIALRDYGRPPVSYDRAVSAPRASEKHPLAA